MTDLNIAFSSLIPPFLSSSSASASASSSSILNVYDNQYSYDYSVCPICKGTSTYAVTNDCGSVGGCTDCHSTFASRKIYTNPTTSSASTASSNALTSTSTNESTRINAEYDFANEEEYDYSTCPRCNGHETSSVTDDGGSIAHCHSCNKEFLSLR